LDDIYVSAGIEEDTSENIVSIALNRPETPLIYPNPVRERIHMDFEHLYPETSRVFLYDTMGKLLYKKRVYEQPFEIDVRDIKPGIYLVKVVSGNVMYVTQIQKL
jgi:hypothetical protein